MNVFVRILGGIIMAAVGAGSLYFLSQASTGDKNDVCFGVVGGACLLAAFVLFVVDGHDGWSKK